MGVDAVVITGTSCAGKTTLAGELATRFDRPTGHIELDAIRRLVVGGVRQMPYPPTDAALEQWATAVQICGVIGRRYRDRGWFFVIDAAVYTNDSPWVPLRVDAWSAALRGIAWQLVVVHPTLAEVERRASIRRGRSAEGDARLAGMHRVMDAWRTQPEALVLDPTGLDVAASADLALDMVERDR
ncbi:MAG: AAA family ATPase [Acidimicrobiales bacterium]